MLKHEKLSHHQNIFMCAAAAASALVNAGAFVFLIAYYQVNDPMYTELVPIVLSIGAFVVFFPFRLLISARSTLWMLGRGLLRWLRVVFLALAALFFLPHEADGGWLRMLVAQWLVLTLVLQAASLALLRWAAYRINNASSNQRQAVFIDLGPEAQRLAFRLHRSPILGIRVAGYYAEAPIDQVSGESYVPARLGGYAAAVRDIEADQFDIVFVGPGVESSPGTALDIMNRLYDSTISIYFMPKSPYLDEFPVSSANIAGVPLLALHETHMLGLSRSLKRAMDLLLGSLALLVAAPAMLLATLAIRLDTPGPIIFRQKRYGEGGAPIVVYKFRSMRTDSGLNPDGTLRQAQVNDDRVTRVGRILRKYSLDELPQLFNVLQGSMSLVGPRPHAAEHNEYYRRQIKGYMLRHTVKPGITGWAQIHGLRGETDTPEKMQQRVRYDRYYIANWSLLLDIKILFRTLLLIAGDRSNAY